jgi:hypothetical protein
VIKPLGIPLTARPFKAYPASFGPSDVRMSNATWNNFTGWCGHEHVPQNDHGDPGAFPWARLVQLATEHDTPAPPKEIDMQWNDQVTLTADQAASLNKARTPGTQLKAGDKISYGYLVMEGGPAQAELSAKVDQLIKLVQAITAR